MPYPIDERMNSVREMYRSAVNRSIDFVTAPNTASDAVEAYQGLPQQESTMKFLRRNGQNLNLLQASLQRREE